MEVESLAHLWFPLDAVAVAVAVGAGLVEEEGGATELVLRNWSKS